MRAFFLVCLAILHSACAFVIPSSPRPRSPRCHHVEAKCDAKKAIAATVSALVLAAAPMAAHAKGGGHGGGGGHSSGGHSSHSSSYHSSSGSSGSSRPMYYRTPARSRSRSSRSSSRSSSYSRSSSSYASAERNIIFPTSAEARDKGGLVCPASLARAGELVDIVDEPGASGVPRTRTAYVIESRPPVQSSLYGTTVGAAQPLPPLESSGCELVVRFADDGTTETISAAQLPPSAFAEASLPLLVLTYFGVIVYDGVGAGSSSGDDGAWERMQRRYEEMNNQQATSARPDCPPPPSGEYWGATEEDDAGDQAVRVTLTFKPDGTFTGHGKDGVDGAYKVRGGRWMAKAGGKVKLAWKEVYDEGFTAICMGTLDPTTAKIDARFVSSRNVGGDFTLKPKPSVF